MSEPTVRRDRDDPNDRNERNERSDIVSVLVVDDHPIVLDGVRLLVDSTTWITLAGYARTGREAITVAEQTQPDVVLLDLRLPDMLGPEVIHGILRGAPGAKVARVLGNVGPGGRPTTRRGANPSSRPSRSTCRCSSAAARRSRTTTRSRRTRRTTTRATSGTTSSSR